MAEITWQDRLAAEAHELREKIARLAAFMCDKEKMANVSEEMARLMRDQSGCMMEYLLILDRRLELAGKEAVAKKKQKLEEDLDRARKQIDECRAVHRQMASCDKEVTRAE